MNLKQIKRQYHKVKSVLEELGSSGQFRTSITVQGSSIQIENERPDEELLTRLVVLMRRFLVPNDTLYYKNVWRFLKREYKEYLTVEIINKVDARIDKLKKSAIPLKINGVSLTNEDVYRLISNSGYFNDIPKIREEVERSYKNVPIVWDIFWHQFYLYNIEAFNITSMLFDVIREIESNELYINLHKDEVIYKCIYCLTHDGKFTTEEHIIPESLGNEDGVLPLGYVCDKCNNGVLSDIDNWFMEFDPIAFLKVLHVPYTKQGKLPSARF